MFETSYHRSSMNRCIFEHCDDLRRSSFRLLHQNALYLQISQGSKRTSFLILAMVYCVHFRDTCTQSSRARVHSSVCGVTPRGYGSQIFPYNGSAIVFVDFTSRLRYGSEAATVTDLEYSTARSKRIPTKVLYRFPVRRGEPF